MPIQYGDGDEYFDPDTPYFYAKHLEKELNREWRFFFQKSAFFGLYRTLP